MVPASFVSLPELPPTPPGKIDRRALAALSAAGARRTQPFVAPRTPTEERLAAIWAELFRFERGGVEDNFFVICGPSLMAVHMAARMSRGVGRVSPVPARHPQRL